MRCIPFLSLLSFLLLAPTAWSSSEKPNFIVFIVDDVSWDDIGCYGNPDVQTPNIDALAKAGIVFENAYLTTSSCSPSRNSIMTGRYPHNTGAAELHTEPPLDMVSLPQVLRENGYYCAQAGKTHLGEYVEGAFHVMHSDRAQQGDGGQANWLRTVRERDSEKPFFFWLASRDAHRPWGDDNPFKGTHVPDEMTVPHYLIDRPQTREDLARYYDEIARFDHYVGEVLDEVEKQGELDNTFVVILADNGRPFPHSKTRVNDRGVKTPFVLSWPASIEGGTRSQALLSAIDLAPTILDIAGIDPEESFQGHSFRRLIREPEGEFRNFVFAEHNWHDYEAHERMVRSANYLYILNSRPEQPQIGGANRTPAYNDLMRVRAIGELTVAQADVFVTPRPQEELYDLNNDPEQWLNVAALPQYQEALEEHRVILEQWMEETGDSIPANLTQDHFLKTKGYYRTSYRDRGEMPGAIHQATENNNKRPF